MGRDYSHIARRCERSVVTAYRELRDLGQSDMASFQACTTLYRVHHPEASVAEARRLSGEDWTRRSLLKKAGLRLLGKTLARVGDQAAS